MTHAEFFMTCHTDLLRPSLGNKINLVMVRKKKDHSHGLKKAVLTVGRTTVSSVVVTRFVTLPNLVLTLCGNVLTSYILYLCYWVSTSVSIYLIGSKQTGIFKVKLELLNSKRSGRACGHII